MAVSFAKRRPLKVDVAFLALPGDATIVDASRLRVNYPTI